MIIATQDNQSSPLVFSLFLGGIALFAFVLHRGFGVLTRELAGWSDIVCRFPDSPALPTGGIYTGLNGFIGNTRLDCSFNIQVCETGLRVSLGEPIFIPWSDIRLRIQKGSCTTSADFIIKGIDNFIIQLPPWRFQQIEPHLPDLPREEQVYS